MTNCPLVSIVTVTRNRGHLIARAIDSVLNQSYTNFEYIIVNGSSDDNTTCVVNSYRDKRIKLINLDENLPFGQTIDVGVENSIGDYVTFLDDDDEYFPTKIEKQLLLIQDLPADFGFVYCWMDYYDENLQKIVSKHRPSLKGFVPEKVVEQPNVSGTPTLFFKKEAFLKLGGWKDNIGIVSDWELAARACQIFKVDFVPEVLVKVNVNHGTVRMSDNKYYEDRLNRTVIFHTHFLNEFKSIFNKFPEKKINHLYIITRSYFILGKWNRAWPFYKELLMNNLNLKHILLPFYCLYLRTFQKWK